MNHNKIIPSLWFCTDKGKLSIVVAYYQNVFGSNFESGNIIPLGETPSGNAEMCEAILFRQKYSLMSTEKKHHAFNDAVSFTINCENQQEIDTYWDYFIQEGTASQCGWCMDKFGLRWQVVPHNLAELMSRPNAFDVMMKQQKIIIDEYLK